MMQPSASQEGSVMKMQESQDETVSNDQDKMGYLLKNNFISDAFLFGDDIEVDQKKLNRFLKRHQSQTRKGGVATPSETAS